MNSAEWMERVLMSERDRLNESLRNRAQQLADRMGVEIPGDAKPHLALVPLLERLEQRIAELERK